MLGHTVERILESEACFSHVKYNVVKFLAEGAVQLLNFRQMSACPEEEKNSAWDKPSLSTLDQAKNG